MERIDAEDTKLNDVVSLTAYREYKKIRMDKKEQEKIKRRIAVLVRSAKEKIKSLKVIEISEIWKTENEFFEHGKKKYEIVFMTIKDFIGSKEEKDERIINACIYMFAIRKEPTPFTLVDLIENKENKICQLVFSREIWPNEK